MVKQEQELRIELAACFRIFDYLGWTELVYNHITVKVPGERAHFLINPFGFHYGTICASDLVKMDIDGNLVGDSPNSVNPAGIILHTAIHAARCDINCIIHTHTDSAMAVACQQQGLRHDNFYSALHRGIVAYHDFEGITVLDDEKPRLVANLGDKNLMILRSHGLVGCGATIPEAFLNTWRLQRACDIQFATDSCGRRVNPIGDEVLEKTEQLLKLQHPDDGAFGQLEFAGMQRLMDKLDPSYRD
tara:strand:+ start:2234 stop:2971 length:738 start_codon:yes stop_codon:yes gene_type:complete